MEWVLAGTQSSSSTSANLVSSLCFRSSLSTNSSTRSSCWSIHLVSTLSISLGLASHLPPSTSNTSAMTLRVAFTIRACCDIISSTPRLRFSAVASLTMLELSCEDGVDGGGFDRPTRLFGRSLRQSGAVIPRFCITEHPGLSSSCISPRPGFCQACSFPPAPRGGSLGVLRTLRFRAGGPFSRFFLWSILSIPQKVDFAGANMYKTCCNNDVVTVRNGLSQSSRSCLKQWLFQDLVCYVNIVTITIGLSYIKGVASKLEFLDLLCLVYVMYITTGFSTCSNHYNMICYSNTSLFLWHYLDLMRSVHTVTNTTRINYVKTSCC